MRPLRRLGPFCLAALLFWLAIFPLRTDLEARYAMAAALVASLATALWMCSGRSSDPRLAAAASLALFGLALGAAHALAPAPVPLFLIAVALVAAGVVFLLRSAFSAIDNERAHAESTAAQALASARAQSCAFERTGIGRVTLDSQAVIVSSNSVFEQMTRSSAASLSGRPLAGLLAESDRGKLLEAVAGLAEHSWTSLEVQTTPEWGLLILALDLRRTGSGDAEVFARDLSVHRALDERIQLSRHHEAAALFARGIAHDFTNLLTIMRGYLDILRPHVPPGPANQRYLEEVDESVRRATALTAKLLNYNRPGVSHRSAVKLSELVQQMHPVLRRMAGDERILEISLEGADAAILADQTQLEQALMNLVLNARDATTTGGRIRLSTCLLPDNQAEVSVGDTGSGMDPITQSRVFEPYFTTKPQGRGIGLASVKAIVSENNGTIVVESEPGKGTVVRLRFPVAAGEAIEAAKPKTVLVVDDEQSVRRLVQSILARSGYAVISAADGLEALEKLSVDKSHIDLLLSDVLMPGLNGHQLARQVKTFIPHLRILMMSGYSPDDVADRTEWPLIQKPFTPKALLSRIEQILAEGGASAEFGSKP